MKQYTSSSSLVKMTFLLAGMQHAIRQLSLGTSGQTALGYEKNGKGILKL
jgi:hypothetical protein